MDNRYSEYQRIRQERTYRTLGKMSWWRIALGVALLVLALFISGLPAQSAASRGHFTLAQRLMIAPGWMEKYKPETKAFIDGGVLYEQGDYAEAINYFAMAEGISAAAEMQDECQQKLSDTAPTSSEYSAP